MKAVQVTDDGAWVDLPTGQVGVLAIQRADRLPGYVTDRGPDGPLLDGLGKLRDGWLDTGDLPVVDLTASSTSQVEPRTLIICWRSQHRPWQVIEAVLLAHPAVTAAQAVGRPDLHAGEVPVAFVTLVPGATATSEELRAWAGDHVPEHAAAPKTVTVLEHSRSPPVGKPFKPALRAEATRGRSQTPLPRHPFGHRRPRSRRGRCGRRRCRSGPWCPRDVGQEALERFAITWRLELS